MEPSTLYCLPIEIVLTADGIAILLNDAKNSQGVMGRRPMGTQPDNLEQK